MIARLDLRDRRFRIARKAGGGIDRGHDGRKISLRGDEQPKHQEGRSLHPALAAEAQKCEEHEKLTTRLMPGMRERAFAPVLQNHAGGRAEGDYERKTVGCVFRRTRRAGTQGGAGGAVACCGGAVYPLSNDQRRGGAEGGGMDDSHPR